MGEPIKDFIAKQFLHQRFHFRCPCIVPLDFEGEIVSYDILNNEIVFHITYKDRLVKLGINHPNLTIEKI